MIPKTLHFIWVGDETRRPDNCVDTWKERHPDWQIKVWGNRELEQCDWRNAGHMQAMFARELNGVADMMRWEILHREGGIVIDADSICLRALEDDFLDNEAFACWENEIARPGLIAAGYFGSVPGNAFLHQIIEDIHDEVSVINERAWRTVGPQRLTDAYRRYQYQDLSIYPSHYFIPEHFSGVRYHGKGPVYASQLWGSTLSRYDRLYLEATEKISAPTRQDDGESPEQAAQHALRQPIAAQHPAPCVQRVGISNDIATLPRLDVFTKLCGGKRVLHVGCGTPACTATERPLHLALAPACARLDGIDPRPGALDAIAAQAPGRLYTRFEDIQDDYDLVIVPELLGHVADAAGLLARLDALGTDCLLISVPDAFQCANTHFEYNRDAGALTEIAPPGQRCWYSPYTLLALLQAETRWAIAGLWFFDGTSILVMATKAKHTSTHRQ
ncbi:glycosyltransferase [Propionivibrio dicarboxylicus]|uniref:Mannosyltransferase OCH1 n=1 Tax=Propionivibrio dicarboxylicus TaxID=83767 RepID=A0A1G8J9T4_9RHOO|nr:glycosyltransferase [Propionivibrio dicarboxylicus]SDI27956.1 Mannosyltransferase OCH1 [Propionivibrio dicarboxylicus]